MAIAKPAPKPVVKPATVAAPKPVAKAPAPVAAPKPVAKAPVVNPSIAAQQRQAQQAAQQRQQQMILQQAAQQRAAQQAAAQQAAAQKAQQQRAAQQQQAQTLAQLRAAQQQAQQQRIQQQLKPTPTPAPQPAPVQQPVKNPFQGYTQPAPVQQPDNSGIVVAPESDPNTGSDLVQMPIMFGQIPPPPVQQPVQNPFPGYQQPQWSVNQHPVQLPGDSLLDQANPIIDTQPPEPVLGQPWGLTDQDGNYYPNGIGYNPTFGGTTQPAQGIQPLGAIARPDITEFGHWADQPAQGIQALQAPGPSVAYSDPIAVNGQPIPSSPYTTPFGG